MFDMERMRPAWVGRFHKESLRGLRMKVGVEEGCLVVEKLGMRRSACLEDIDGVWKILTNDMELNEKTAMKVLEKIPYLSSATSGEPA